MHHEWTQNDSAITPTVMMDMRMQDDASYPNRWTMTQPRRTWTQTMLTLWWQSSQQTRLTRMDWICDTRRVVPLGARRWHVWSQQRLTRKRQGSARHVVQLTWNELFWLVDMNRCYDLIGQDESRHLVSSAHIGLTPQFNYCAETMRCHGNEIINWSSKISKTYQFWQNLRLTYYSPPKNDWAPAQQ